MLFHALMRLTPSLEHANTQLSTKPARWRHRSKLPYSRYIKTTNPGESAVLCRSEGSDADRRVLFDRLRRRFGECQRGHTVLIAHRGCRGVAQDIHEMPHFSAVRVGVAI